MTLWCRKRISHTLLWMLLPTAVVMPTIASAAPTITWTPTTVIATVSTPEPQTFRVSFVADQDLGAGDVFVVPELRPVVNVSPLTLSSIRKGQTVQLTLTISAPPGSPVQTIEGTVHIRSTGPPRSFAVPLPVNVTITPPDVTTPPRAHTLTLISGNGPIGGQDSANEFSLDGGSSFQNAFAIAPSLADSLAYHTLAGTQYIGVNPDASGPENASTRYRTTFTLPTDFSSPSMSFEVHADNVATVFLNGVQVGQQPVGELFSNFRHPAELFTVSAPSLFRAGVNTLEVETFNFHAQTALDYRATVAFQSVTQVAIDLTLSSNVIVAGSAVSLRKTVTDAAGRPVDSPSPIEITTVPLGKTAGPMPIIVGDTINIDSGTAGSFAVHTRILGTMITDTETLAVIPANAQSRQLVSVSQALNSISDALSLALLALEASDSDRVLAAKAQLQAAASSLDIRRLEITAPFAPKGGFPLSVTELVVAGRPETTEDVDYGIALAPVIREYDLLVAGVAALSPGNILSTEIVDLNNRATNLSSLLDELQAVTPTVHGVTANVEEISRLITHQIPTLALLAVEKAAATIDAVGVPVPARSSALMLAAEQMVSPSDVLELAGKAILLSRRMYGPVIAELARIMVLVVAEGLLRQVAQSGDLCAAVSGGSLSVVTPGSPDSYLEGRHLGTTTANNPVTFIGPEAPPSAFGVIESLTRDPIDIPGVYDKFDELITALGTFYDNAHVRGSSIEPETGVICNGDRLIFNNGFPDVVGSCFLCISPIVILHHNVATGGRSVFTTIMVRE